jgi:hypothetical protein
MYVHTSHGNLLGHTSPIVRNQYYDNNFRQSKIWYFLERNLKTISTFTNKFSQHSFLSFLIINICGPVIINPINLNLFKSIGQEKNSASYILFSITSLRFDNKVDCTLGSRTHPLLWLSKLDFGINKKLLTSFELFRHYFLMHSLRMNCLISTVFFCDTIPRIF